MATAPRYLPTLDGWRAVAIAMVMATHQHYPVAALSRLSVYGAVGVHLFFALSGLLITYRLLEEHQRTGGVSWRSFYKRRFFRIIPAAFLYLAVVAVLLGVSRQQLVASAFFWRNYLTIGATEGWYTGHYWSLSVEEHFYLLWPALLALAGLWRGFWLAPVLAIATAVWRGLDGHFGWVASLNPGLKDSVWRTDYRLDGLLWGCAMAFLFFRYHSVITVRVRSWHLPAIIAGIVLVLAFPFPGSIALFSFLMCLVPLATVARPLSFLELAPLRWIGRISYGLYLWQQLFSPVEGAANSLGVLQTFPLNILCTFAVAAASYYILERPLLRLSHRS